MECRKTREEWPEVRLDAVLTGKQMSILEMIIKKYPKDPQRINKIKAYLRRSEQQLLLRGVMPDFLAYSVIARIDG